MSDVQRLFRRDAAEAYQVLTREHIGPLPPYGRVRLFFYRAKLAFLGMSNKLTPARRILFLVSLSAAVIGFFQLGSNDSSPRDPLWFLASTAGLVFLLALELVDRIRVRDELEVARALQRELLPRATPSLPGYEVAHSYRTANEVGGDYYDFLPLPDGRVAIVIGDASGHGMASGLLMAIANATLKLALDLDPATVKVLHLLNRVMWRTGDRRSFMTLFYGLLDPASGAMEYACAGHPFPLLRRADGTVSELGVGGLPLGVRAGLEISAATVEIEAGDTLTLYTDGLPEATDRQGNAFGYERLRNLAAAAGGPQQVHDRLLGAFRSFVGDEPLRDDACLVVLSRL